MILAVRRRLGGQHPPVREPSAGDAPVELSLALEPVLAALPRTGGASGWRETER
ncbi:MAG: hypothetical protein L6Q84_35630 [Polyangiaceae bacterium]|nr:hypothetical protein [Polyangiaceae bacterium]